MGGFQGPDIKRFEPGCTGKRKQFEACTAWQRRVDPASETSLTASEYLDHRAIDKDMEFQRFTGREGKRRGLHITVYERAQA